MFQIPKGQNKQSQILSQIPLSWILLSPNPQNTKTHEKRVCLGFCYIPKIVSSCLGTQNSNEKRETQFRWVQIPSKNATAQIGENLECLSRYSKHQKPKLYLLLGLSCREHLLITKLFWFPLSLSHSSVMVLCSFRPALIFFLLFSVLFWLLGIFNMHNKVSVSLPAICIQGYKICVNSTALHNVSI